MVYFKEIKPTRHYFEEHEDDVPWKEVIEVVLRNKSPRKKGERYIIDTNNHYIMFKLENDIPYIINAKTK